MKITIAFLHKHNPMGCPFARFACDWPNGIELNADAIRQAIGAGLDFDLLVNLALNPGELKAFVREAIATGEVAYRKKEDLIAEYAKANSSAYKVEEYRARIASINKEWRDAQIAAFVAILEQTT